MRKRRASVWTGQTVALAMPTLLPHLQAAHVGGARDQREPGQQQQQRVGHQAVHRLSIQQQAAEHRLLLPLQNKTHSSFKQA